MIKLELPLIVITDVHMAFTFYSPSLVKYWIAFLTA